MVNHAEPSTRSCTLHRRIIWMSSKQEHVLIPSVQALHTSWQYGANVPSPVSRAQTTHTAVHARVSRSPLRGTDFHRLFWPCRALCAARSFRSLRPCLRAREQKLPLLVAGSLLTCMPGVKRLTRQPITEPCSISKRAGSSVKEMDL